MSIFLDVTGTVEEERKGSTPKGHITCKYVAWA